MPVSDADIQASAATNMVAARNDISGLTSAVNDTAALNDNSGILERLGVLEAGVSAIDTWIGNSNFNPAGCYDSTNSIHYVWIVGVNRHLWRKWYTVAAGWSTGGVDGWHETNNDPAEYWTSGPTVYFESGLIHIFVAGLHGTIYSSNFNSNTGVLADWVNLNGAAGP